jgi:hypothetical protein
MKVRSLLVAAVLLMPTMASGQSQGVDEAQAVNGTANGTTAGTYDPITNGQRIEWIVDGTIGLRSLGIGVITASWQTAWNTPEEWHRSWSGAGKRYLAREADVGISNTLEAGLGALWGEEPRYIPSRRHGVGARTRYAVKTVFLAQRRDGHLAPAWGRYVANTVNNLVENTWLPSSVTSPSQTVIRSADGFLGRLIGNVYEEFWPDVRRIVRRR